MRKLGAVVFVAIVFIFSACGRNSDGTITEKEHIADIVLQSPSVDQARFPPHVVKPDAQVSGKKIIKEGSIEFETNDLRATRSNIISALKNAGGYVSGDNENTNYDNSRKELLIKFTYTGRKI